MLEGARAAAAAAAGSVPWWLWAVSRGEEQGGCEDWKKKKNFSFLFF